MQVTGTRPENVKNEAKPPINLLDPNTYATRKTIAQGMMDIALLTANASQLKQVLQIGKSNSFYTLMILLISSSIVLQQKK
ncbi:Ninjurin-1-like protein [Leptotrombidium deliense]|uniref:Ninjurin-1-like protein n=1 Tax=Leptotrombidium deliense TaxID=299467 RepID=A0A443SRX5_9ACAR|nr:Ninjurin-1-like protein [Leptotrombidium deliense]